MPTSAALFAVFTASQLLAQIFTPGAKLEKIHEGGHLTEGVAFAPDGTVFFSDITLTSETGMQAGHILRYDPAANRTVVYRSPSGMSNRLKFDAQGRRITRTDLATGKSVILAALFENRPLNSPNGIAMSSDPRGFKSSPKPPATSNSTASTMTPSPARAECNL